jgi:hypothetical protein
LRKTLGQRLVEATGSIAVVQHQLGHAESRTTERVYAQSPVDRMLAGQAALGGNSQNCLCLPKKPEIGASWFDRHFSLGKCVSYSKEMS